MPRTPTAPTGTRVDCNTNKAFAAGLFHPCQYHIETSVGKVGTESPSSHFNSLSSSLLLRGLDLYPRGKPSMTEDSVHINFCIGLVSCCGSHISASIFDHAKAKHWRFEDPGIL